MQSQSRLKAYTFSAVPHCVFWAHSHGNDIVRAALSLSLRPLYVRIFISLSVRSFSCASKNNAIKRNESKGRQNEKRRMKSAQTEEKKTQGLYVQNEKQHRRASEFRK